MLDIVVRSAVVYLAIVVGLRMAGKRHLGQLSIPDFVLILLISNAVQNAMVGNDSSLAGGLAAAGTLLLLNIALSYLIFRSKGVKHALEGSPVLLVYQGVIAREHLEREEITEEELLGVVREHGLKTFAEVYTAILELDGTISVVPMSEASPRQSGTLRQKKVKWRRLQ